MHVKQEIINRIASLREFMSRMGGAAFITPSTDPHASEYVPEYWESRMWISGFSGSSGTVVITLNGGGLWTDSRYYLQTEEEMAGTGIALFKDGMPKTPSIGEWLEDVLQPGI